MNKKINVLFAPSDTAGVGHFRSIWPAQEINKKYPDFFVEIAGEFTDKLSYYDKFDIIHFHRQLGPFDNQLGLITELKKRGKIVVMDLDDYWNPPSTHPLHIAAMKEEMPRKITTTFKMVDYVTTTTNIFANHIKPFNKNVAVIPNGINMNHPMWQPKDVKKTDKVRVAWIGGSSHMSDLTNLKTSMNILHNDETLRDKYQIVMCGYDIRGYMTEVDQKNNVVGSRKMLPHETIWNNFEQIFTNNYHPKIVPEDYKKYLHKFKNEPYTGFDVYESNYVRRWTLQLTKYGEHYNYCDVCLAPLDENKFNEVKSELKIIEAGLMRKTLIAQDFGIYRELISNGVNGILVPKARNVRGWYEAIKKVIEDKEYREMLADNLYNFVIDKYTLEAVTVKRVNFYREIYNKKHADMQLEGSDPKLVNAE